jgi:hypothetical protein
LVEANRLTTWPQFEAFLKEQGRERVPEEVLLYYRVHFECYAAYLADCDCVLAWAQRTHAELAAQVGELPDAKAHRKQFAALASKRPFSGLLFAALDGQLDRERVRKILREPNEAVTAVTDLGLT